MNTTKKIIEAAREKLRTEARIETDRILAAQKARREARVDAARESLTTAQGDEIARDLLGISDGPEDDGFEWAPLTDDEVARIDEAAAEMAATEAAERHAEENPPQAPTCIEEEIEARLTIVEGGVCPLCVDAIPHEEPAPSVGMARHGDDVVMTGPAIGTDGPPASRLTMTHVVARTTLLVASDDDCHPAEAPWLRMDREGGITLGTSRVGADDDRPFPGVREYPLPPTVDPVALAAEISSGGELSRALVADLDGSEPDAYDIERLLYDAECLVSDHPGYEGVHDARTWIEQGSAEGILDQDTLATMTDPEIESLATEIETSAADDCCAVLYDLRLELGRLREEAREVLLEGVWNLTAREITICRDGHVSLPVPMSGLVARRRALRTPSTAAVSGVPGIHTEYGDVYLTSLGDEERPMFAPEPGEIYICSGMVCAALRAMGRTDVTRPVGLVRDSENRVIGCEGLESLPVTEADVEKLRLASAAHVARLREAEKSDQFVAACHEKIEKLGDMLGPQTESEKARALLDIQNRMYMAREMNCTEIMRDKEKGGE